WVVQDGPSEILFGAITFAVCGLPCVRRRAVDFVPSFQPADRVDPAGAGSVSVSGAPVARRATILFDTAGRLLSRDPPAADETASAPGSAPLASTCARQRAGVAPKRSLNRAENDPAWLKPHWKATSITFVAGSRSSAAARSSRNCVLSAMIDVPR